MKLRLGMVVMTGIFLMAGRAVAQDNLGPCPYPGAGMADVVGAVVEFQSLPPGCTSVDFTRSLDEAASPDLTLPVTRATVPTAAVAVPVVVPEEDTGGVATQYDNRQMVRVGELDAMQGRPLNMAHAGDLSYLQGYTRGQKSRMPDATAAQQERRGFSGF